jgi:hypothetical protein
MGNSISSNERVEIEECISEIMNYHCPILDIGKTIGITAYIDFIKNSEIDKNVNVVKGLDLWGRFFIVVKCEYVYADGRREKTFSIFFQRYNDNKTLWLCCGHDGPILMGTDGGMNVEQFTFLRNLLKNGKVGLETETVYNTYLSCFHNGLPRQPYESEYPIAVNLGYSE